MRIQLNGADREVADEATVADVLTELDAPRDGVAVAVDGEVVRRGQWTEVVVSEGARLEVLTAVQGG